ncbi:MAG: DMT family transporter [Desulfotignum sp.]|nr:DMT family transporter [Desulfotignum sp.]MCF8086696.1 DMT family transporter [Desulfotignum sp.]MCF8136264.1 DMT family transporter [Desulfotignum sp.]
MTFVKLFLTAFFWGGTFIAGKQLAGQVSPSCTAFLRFTIASIFLLLLTRRMEGRLPRIRFNQLVWIFLSGLTGIFAYNLFFFTGLNFINANRASLIIATNPIFISVFSALLFKESLTPGKIIGLVLSVSGAMTIISNGHPWILFQTGIGAGEMAILGCVVSWVSYSLLAKPMMTTLSPVAAVCYSSVAGTIMLFFPAVYNGLFQALPGYTLPHWAGFFYLGFFGTVLGFFWYYQGIQKIGPTRAGVFINFVPVSAVILSFIILNEPVTPALAVGAILVLSGVYLTTRPAQTSP